MTKLLAVLIFTFGLRTLASESTFCKWDCSNSSTFTRKSAYETNLNLLLESLSAHANSSYGFFNTSRGKPSDGYAVYGSFLCMGYVGKVDCRECVIDATVRIKEECPMAKESILWFDKCMLRYSDRNYFSTTDKAPLLFGYNGENVPRPAEFRKLLSKTMGKLITLAPVKPDKKYAYKSLETPLYTFVQCTPDILPASCKVCLQNATSNLLKIQTEKIGGRVMLPSCLVRFEKYPFYTETSKRHASSRLAISITPILAVVLLCAVLWFSLKREWRRRNNVEDDPIVYSNQKLTAYSYTVGSQFSELHSLQFDGCAIEAATDYFSNHNKLGEGGFGPVYRGTLPCGKKIAAKRLSQGSKQGMEEFRNEVELIAMLQHRNLVRLLGFAKEREETILVYEYVPNGSLDQLLFENPGPQQRIKLDWSARHKIMVGVARGLLYLHEDSRLRIIHRDLKPSNILLDDNMNPKISDFGLARIVGAEQTQGRTNRIAGTFGYMSPEYAMYGQFSVKSDMFSFGVLMLEIITGKKNQYSYVSDHYAGLLDFVWEHWRVGALAQIVDPTLSDSYPANEVNRCIQIGLLCVQNDNEARPTIDSVVLMLSNAASVSLPLPEQPACFFPRVKHEQLSQNRNSDQSSEMLNSSEIIPQCSD